MKILQSILFLFILTISACTMEVADPVSEDNSENLATTIDGISSLTSCLQNEEENSININCNVGIGRIPNYKLDVNGSARIKGSLNIEPTDGKDGFSVYSTKGDAIYGETHFGNAITGFVLEGTGNAGYFYNEAVEEIPTTVFLSTSTKSIVAEGDVQLDRNLKVFGSIAVEGKIYYGKQEVSDEIDKLKEKNKDLEEKFSYLEERFNDLEKKFNNLNETYCLDHPDQETCQE